VLGAASDDGWRAIIGKAQKEQTTDYRHLLFVYIVMQKTAKLLEFGLGAFGF
jgi:hypothetical protein